MNCLSESQPMSLGNTEKVPLKIRTKTRIPINILHLTPHRKEKGDKLWMYTDNKILYRVKPNYIIKKLIEVINKHSKVTVCASNM